jgi:hypothetical protein
MATSAEAKRLQKLADQIPDHQSIWNIFRYIERSEGENLWIDHTIAMIGASYVDKALEVAIISRLVPLKTAEQEAIFRYEKRGFLSDLSSKIKMAYALNIIGPKTRIDLDHIRAIRNSFAHALIPLGFEYKEVVDVCNLLYSHENLGLLGRWASGDDSRAKYINTTLSIGTKLKDKIRVEEGTTIVMHNQRAFPIRWLP